MAEFTPLDGAGTGIERSEEVPGLPMGGEARGE